MPIKTQAFLSISPLANRKAKLTSVLSPYVLSAVTKGRDVAQMIVLAATTRITVRALRFYRYASRRSDSYEFGLPTVRLFALSTDIPAVTSALKQKVIVGDNFTVSNVRFVHDTLATTFALGKLVQDRSYNFINLTNYSGYYHIQGGGLTEFKGFKVWEPLSNTQDTTLYADSGAYPLDFLFKYRIIKNDISEPDRDPLRYYGDDLHASSHNSTKIVELTITRSDGISMNVAYPADWFNSVAVAEYKHIDTSTKIYPVLPARLDGKNTHEYEKNNVSRSIKRAGNFLALEPNYLVETLEKQYAKAKKENPSGSIDFEKDVSDILVVFQTRIATDNPYEAELLFHTMKLYGSMPLLPDSVGKDHLGRKLHVPKHNEVTITERNFRYSLIFSYSTTETVNASAFTTSQKKLVNTKLKPPIKGASSRYCVVIDYKYPNKPYSFELGTLTPDGSNIINTQDKSDDTYRFYEYDSTNGTLTVVSFHNVYTSFNIPYLIPDKYLAVPSWEAVGFKPKLFKIDFIAGYQANKSDKIKEKFMSSVTMPMHHDVLRDRTTKVPLINPNVPNAVAINAERRKSNRYKNILKRNCLEFGVGLHIATVVNVELSWLENFVLDYILPLLEGASFILLFISLVVNPLSAPQGTAWKALFTAAKDYIVREVIGLIVKEISEELSPELALAVAIALSFSFSSESPISGVTGVVGIPEVDFFIDLTDAIISGSAVYNKAQLAIVEEKQKELQIAIEEQDEELDRIKREFVDTFPNLLEDLEHPDYSGLGVSEGYLSSASMMLMSIYDNSERYRVTTESPKLYYARVLNKSNAVRAAIEAQRYWHQNQVTLPTNLDTAED